ncbi:MAG: hypothetical protein PPP58_04495 [Natronomonas sp.]
MSSKHHRSVDAQFDDLSEKARRLAEYLRAEAAENGGELYVKGKFIADDVELSAKEIGALMIQLQDSLSQLSIEKWSYTSATTWRVKLP